MNLNTCAELTSKETLIDQAMNTATSIESVRQAISDNLALIERGITQGKVSPRDYKQQKAIAAVPGGLTSAKPKRRRSNSYQTMLDDSLNNRAIALAEEGESRMSLTTRLIIAGIELLENQSN